MDNQLNIPSEDDLMKIQDVLLCDSMELDSTTEMYCRCSARLGIDADGSCILPAGQYYDFFTFINSLSVLAWDKYTNANGFYIVLDIKGDFEAEVFGHFKAGKEYQKEWCGRYARCNHPERTKIIIPCNSLMSTCVSFGIWAHGNVNLYDAYYATEGAFIEKKQVKLAVVSEGDPSSRNVTINKDIFDKKVTGYGNDKVSIDWIDFSGKEFDISELEEKGYTHVIRIDEGTMINPDSINRLSAMLCLLKDEYAGCSFRALPMDYDKPNMQMRMVLDDCNLDDPEFNTSVLNMNVWNSIIDSEDRAIALSSWKNLTEGAFECVPTKSDKSDGNIFFNGLFAWKSNECRPRFSDFKTDDDEEFKCVQKVLIKESLGIVDVTRHMYIRSSKNVIIGDDGRTYLPAGAYYEFFTYYNSFSIGKWKKYTNLDNLSLVLDIKGDFEIDLFGHYKVGNNIQRENFVNTVRHFDKRSLLKLDYPNNMDSIVVAFGIKAETDLCVYDIYYGSKVKKADIKSPMIAMVTTTFKKENFINKNITLLTENLFSDDRYKDAFYWNIIDNGKTLDTNTADEHIKILPNANLGGAGGFARGMMVSLRQERDYTHILLMDDDVVFIPESFKRLYMILSLIKDEYEDYFISGAMLNMDAPNIQHENTGKLVEDGYCIPLHSGRDLNLWDQVVLNEVDPDDLSYRYAAWWFCCIPTTVATEDNLPLPVFVRGDDMEYSLRNNAKFITMNGISISHMGFVGKFNAPMDFYQSKRNELIVFTILPSLSEIDSFGCIKELFWQEMNKFDYTGAEFLADAVEDFLKGPEWFSSVDLFTELQKRREKDDVPKKITDKVRKLIDYGTLYREEGEMSSYEKRLYEKTYNGQTGTSRDTEDIGIIPYNFSYHPEKMKFTCKNYAIDTANDKYIEFKKDKERFAELKERWDKLEEEYLSTKETMAKRYQEYEKEITNIGFWDKYIEKLSN